MIRTEKDMLKTIKLLAKFKQELDEHRQEFGVSRPGDMHYLVEQGLEGQISDLEFQIHTFQALKGGEPVRLRRLTDLGPILAAARVVMQLTQAELAQKVNMKQQQIQRYEASGYRGAAIERVDRVVEALGIELS